MNKLFLALWIFLGSLFGASHQSPTQHTVQPSATPTILPMLIPTPTLAPGQKAIYTFYIQTTPHKIVFPRGMGIHQSDTGKVFTVDIGTLIDVNFGRVGKFHGNYSGVLQSLQDKSRPSTVGP
jgi:hypothetical protein